MDEDLYPGQWIDRLFACGIIIFLTVFAIVMTAIYYRNDRSLSEFKQTCTDAGGVYEHFYARGPRCFRKGIYIQ